nr:hypothetical protein [Bradyrhizobium sp. ARR65]
MEEQRPTKRRRRFRQAEPLKQRLLHSARAARERANQLQPGAEQEALLRKAREAEIVARLDEWLSRAECGPVTRNRAQT